MRINDLLPHRNEFCSLIRFQLSDIKEILTPKDGKLNTVTWRIVRMVCIEQARRHSSVRHITSHASFP